MGFGDKKEAWEASVNIPDSELGSPRQPLLTADKDDHLMPYVQENFARETDLKSYLYLLKDGPVVKDGKRYARWLYYKAFGTSGIRGYYIYDNGEGELPDVN